MVKRLGVFCFFDKDEIIQRGDEYLLEGILIKIRWMLFIG